MFRKYFSLLLWLSFSSLFANQIGTWTPHLSYHVATQTFAVDNEIYALFGENFLMYNTTDTQVHRYSRANGMNGKAILTMGYSPTSKQVVLLYADGMVDLFEPQANRFLHLNYLKDHLQTTGTPRSLHLSGNYATIVTTKGVALYDVQRKEFRGFYAQSVAVQSATVWKGSLYVATSQGIKAGALTANLYDATQWNTLTSQVAHQLLAFGDRLYFLTSSEGLWTVSKPSSSGAATLTKISDTHYTSVTTNGTTATFCSPSAIAVYTISSPHTPSQTYVFPNQFQSLSRTADGRFWAAEGKKGIVGYTGATTLTPNGEIVGGYGPIRDLGGRMTFVGGRLLVAGGTFDVSLGAHLPGTAMYYEQGKWTNLQDEGVGEQIGWKYENVTGLVQDPKDAKHHFLATAERGLLEFKDGKYVHRYHEGNAPLHRYVLGARIDALQYDGAGRLWLVNNGVDTLFRMLLPSGKWESLFVPALKGFRHIKDVLIDDKGRLWCISAAWHGPYTGGVACVNTNGTLTNTDDDETTFLPFMTNTEGTKVDLQPGVFTLVQDLNGQLWFGAYNGVYVITSPDDFGKTDWQVEQPKVARNDGTNLADYLLSGIHVTAIAVDGANRKWIGTAASGVYLVSPDGSEILQHFTTENSLLLSNQIQSIATNMETGEVFFGTSAGIISYQSDATKAYDALDRSQLKIYPNPVAHDYTGQVTIVGLTSGAHIKIMTTSGFAVATGRASGGAYTWNLQSPSGERVATGVYYVLIATEDGKTGIVGKVVVI